jgi:plasmid stabilization system protein ParE
MPESVPPRHIEFRPQAEAEVLDAFDWYRERSEDAADRFERQLRELVHSIAQRPGNAPQYPGYPEARFRNLKSFPFLVIYREVGGIVEILAVAHAKRRRGYWADRIE